MYVFRHGHAAKSENGDAGDFGRALSDKGIKQAKQLGRTIAAAGIVFDQVICSAAGRAQETASLAAKHFKLNPDHGWFVGENWELYSPKSQADNAALWAATNELERLFNDGLAASAMSYSTFKKLDKTGFMDRFMKQTRRLVGAMQLSEAKNVAIFNHAVMGNAVAEALFPQHAAVLGKIELAPCDCIRATATTCQHIPLMT
ncbi:MAG: histidine phosphatase family protein [Candidatus Paceibacterota bacterium]